MVNMKNEPAMPIVSNGNALSAGLTKREMMAMHIFSGMMSNNSYVGGVKLAVELADELLAELDRTSK